MCLSKRSILRSTGGILISVFLDDFSKLFRGVLIETFLSSDSPGMEMVS